MSVRELGAGARTGTGAGQAHPRRWCICTASSLQKWMELALLALSAEEKQTQKVCWH